MSDRLACGMAIILRVSNHKLLKLHEWDLLGNLIGKGTNYEKSWRYALDGIASFTEQFICPSSSDAFDDNGEKVVPLQGVTMLADILLNFVNGGLPKGTALIEVLSCLERLCLSLMFHNQPSDDVSFPSSALPLDLWKRIVLVFYDAFTSSESEASRQAMEYLQQITLTQQVNAISKDTWIQLLDQVLSKQPKIDDFDRRIRAGEFIGKALLMTVPELSNDDENWDKLAVIITKFSDFISESLQAGRRNSRTSTLFESTVQNTTNLSNVFYFLAESKDQPSEFLNWVGGTLLIELEKFGAAGGSLRSNGVVPKARTNVGMEKVN